MEATDKPTDPASDGVRLIRRLYHAWNEVGPEAVLDLLDTDFEWVNPPYAVEPGVRRGPDAWMLAAENLDASFDAYRHDPGEMIDAGNKVIAMATFCARGRGSGVAVKKPEPHVWTIRDGKVTRLEWFNHEGEALRAAGLGAG